MALPKPLAIVALVHLFSKLGNGEYTAVLNEGATITHFFKIMKHVTDATLSEMPALAFEDQKRHIPSKNTFRTFEDAHLSALDVDLQNRYPVILVEIVV